MDALVLRHDCLKFHGDVYMLSAAKDVAQAVCGFRRYKSYADTSCKYPSSGRRFIALRARIFSALAGLCQQFY